MITAVIVQARMTGTRYPGKVLTPVLGRPLLAYQLERLRRSKADFVIVATTTNDLDDAVAEIAQQSGCKVVRGSEADVASRYLLAADTYGVDLIVRSTADCPLIDPATVDAVIDRFAVGDADHVEVLGVPDGMGCEAFQTAVLRRVYPDMSDLEREHVSLYLRQRPEEFRPGLVMTGLGLEEERWTIDTPADRKLVRAIIEGLYPTTPAFTITHILALLYTRPDLRSINSNVSMNPLDRQLLDAARDRAIHDFAPVRGDL